MDALLEFPSGCSSTTLKAICERKVVVVAWKIWFHGILSLVCMLFMTRTISKKHCYNIFYKKGRMRYSIGVFTDKDGYILRIKDTFLFFDVFFLL